MVIAVNLEDTEELTKRLSYTLAVTGLVLLGGYAVMLAQK